MKLIRFSVPMSEEMIAYLKRRAMDKHTSASEIVRRTIRESDGYLFDKREQELLRKVAEK